MDIEQIKQKLAQVGLPLYGTDEELINRAKVNGLVFGVEEVVSQPEEGIAKLKEAEQEAQPRRGRPRGR